MAPTGKSTLVGRHVVLRMVRNYKLLYRNFFSTSLRTHHAKLGQNGNKWKAATYGLYC